MVWSAFCRSSCRRQPCAGAPLSECLPRRCRPAPVPTQAQAGRLAQFEMTVFERLVGGGFESTHSRKVWSTRPRSERTVAAPYSPILPYEPTFRRQICERTIEIPSCQLQCRICMHWRSQPPTPCCQCSPDVVRSSQNFTFSGCFMYGDSVADEGSRCAH